MDLTETSITLHNSNDSLYKSHFVNMMPQRGFLTSKQHLITAIDVDLDYDAKFYATVFTDDDKPFVFIKNGPLKINPYQKSFKIVCDDAATFDFFANCKFYKPEGNYKTKDGIWAFAEPDYYFVEIVFKKNILNNTIEFFIEPETIFTLLKTNALICTPAGQAIDPFYGFKIYINLNQSSIMFYREGYENVLSFIDKKFEELKISGALYKTRNGLRIFLTDKFRDISVDENVFMITSLMEQFMMDKGFLNAYKSKPDRLTTYLVRLTPKLKNYEKLDNSYKTILNELESTNLSSKFLEKNVVPLKYDFNKITYGGNNSDININNAFDILKKLIFKYLKHKDYAVCRFIKKYDYTGENNEIIKYLSYHDKWTKAHHDSKFLI